MVSSLETGGLIYLVSGMDISQGGVRDFGISALIFLNSFSWTTSRVRTE